MFFAPFFSLCMSLLVHIRVFVFILEPCLLLNPAYDLQGLDAPLQQYPMSTWHLSGMDLLQLTSKDLENLGVNKIGHQELILEAVEKLCFLVRNGCTWRALLDAPWMHPSPTLLLCCCRLDWKTGPVRVHIRRWTSTLSLNFAPPL